MRKHDVIHKTRSALHIARSSEEDRDTATIVNMSVKFREVWSRDVFELSERTDTQTGKEEYLYTQSAQAWITQLYVQITPCLPFLRERSPDVTTTATEAADIQLQLTTHLSTPKG